MLVLFYVFWRCGLIASPPNRIKTLTKKRITRVNLVYLIVIVKPVQEMVDESSNARALYKQIEKK